MARAREFDIDDVLEKSLNVFWTKGYKNASLADLTSATGLHKGSLYGAFGSKEDLFIKSLEKYAVLTRKKFLTEGSPTDYIKKFFERLVKEASSKENSRGCFILNSNVEFGVEQSRPAHLSRILFKEIERNFKITIEKAIKLGELPQSFDKNAFRSRLLGAIFSIKEISRFSNNRKMFKDIANGVLRDIGQEI